MTVRIELVGGSQDGHRVTLDLDSPPPEYYVREYLPLRWHLQAGRVFPEARDIAYRNTGTISQDGLAYLYMVEHTGSE